MKKILCTISILALIIAINIHGMKKEDDPKKSTISYKQNTGVSCENLIFEKKLPKQPTKVARQARTSSTKDSDKIDKTYVSSFNLAYNDVNKHLYFLCKHPNDSQFLFSKNTVNISKPEDLEKPAQSFYYQNPYFFYLANTVDNNTINVFKELKDKETYLITHNKPIINFGNIEDIVFTGSSWPSIKKTVIPTEQSNKNTVIPTEQSNKNTVTRTKPPYIDLKPEPFIENAFLLGCKDNCMVIAKVNAKNNGAFWFWRRFFQDEQNVYVTLYALFFDIKNIQNVTKKEITLLLEEAEEKNSAKNDHVSVIKIATNVLLTAQSQTDPAKYFPKVAIAHDTAIVIHTEEQAFNNTNPKVSIVYKNKQNSWETNATDLKHFITKQKQILDKYIRLPYLDEIKNIYLTTIDNQDLCMLVSQKDGKRFCADGVYFLPMQDLKQQKKKENREFQKTDPTANNGQDESDVTQNKEKDISEKNQPLWHVDIQCEKKIYNAETEKYTSESWKATEEIVASTFDYNNKKLFLITQQIQQAKTTNNEKKSNPKIAQQLITIDIQNFLNPIEKNENV